MNSTTDPLNKDELDAAAKKTVQDYGETLKLLREHDEAPTERDIDTQLRAKLKEEL